MKTYNRAAVLDAIAAFEAMQELHMGQDYPPLTETWHQSGVCEMRERAIEVGAIADKLWQALDEDTQDVIGPFDWEFLPIVICELEWNARGFVEPSDLTERVHRRLNLSTDAGA